MTAAKRRQGAGRPTCISMQTRLSSREKHCCPSSATEKAPQFLFRYPNQKTGRRKSYSGSRRQTWMALRTATVWKPISINLYAWYGYIRQLIGPVIFFRKRSVCSLAPLPCVAPTRLPNPPPIPQSKAFPDWVQLSFIPQE